MTKRAYRIIKMRTNPKTGKFVKECRCDAKPPQECSPKIKKYPITIIKKEIKKN